jgi:rhodanese-related sulfurtransferase
MHGGKRGHNTQLQSKQACLRIGQVLQAFSLRNKGALKQRQKQRRHTMASTVKEMLSAANAAVPRLAPAELQEMMRRGDVLLVDVRDQPELAGAGKIKGAIHVSRGMLEFRADPESPYHLPAFGKHKPVALYCASGGRSALAGKTLKELGYETVYNAGAFKQLADAGLPTEPA